MYIKIERGEEVVYPRMNPGFIRQNLWGAFWGTLIVSVLFALT